MATKTKSQLALERVRQKYGVSGTTSTKSEKRGQSNSASSIRINESAESQPKSEFERVRQKYGLREISTPTEQPTTKSKNKPTTKIEDARTTRIKEINSELRKLAEQRAGLDRAKMYGNVGTMLEENNKKTAELKAELKNLERVGIQTPTELIQFEIDDAKEKLSALGGYNPTARISPSEAEAYRKRFSEANDLKKKINTLEAYQAEIKKQEKLNKLNENTTRITSKEDFEQNSKYSPLKPKTEEELKAAGYKKDLEGNWFKGIFFRDGYTGEDSDLYTYINDKSKRLSLEVDSEQQTGINTYKTFGYHTLTEDEKGAFNYLYHQDRKNGTNTAEEYLNSIRPLLEYRAMELESGKYAKLSKEAPLLMSGISLGTNLANAFMFPAKVAATATETYEDMPILDMYGNRTQAIRGAVSEDMSGIGKLAYNAGMSIGDMGVAMLSGGGSKKVIQAIMSSSAGSSAISNAKMNGASDAKALIQGLGSAAIEWATEKYSIEALLKNPATIKGYITKNIITEGTEEGVANISNIALDAIVSEILGERNEIEQRIDYLMLYEGKTDKEAFQIAFNEKLQSLGEDVLVGGITGFGMSSAVVTPAVVKSAVDKVQGKNGKPTVASLNETIDVLNELIQDDTLKMQPLSKKATKEEIAERQKEVSAVALAFDNAVKKAEQNEEQITQEETTSIDDMSPEEARAAKYTDALETAAKEVVASRNAIPKTASYKMLEEKSRNNEPLSVEEVKKVTGFGEEGSKLVAELANKEGGSFDQVITEVKDKYLSGFSLNENLQVNKETTDNQINAFTAGKKDAVMNKLKAKRSTQSLERDLIEQGVPFADRRNIIQTVIEIEGSLAETKHSISSVVSGVRKITNNLAKLISQRVGNVQNLWGLLHINLKALQSDTISNNRDLVSAYVDTYLDAMKNNESRQYNEISAGVQNVSGALTEYLVTGIVPEGVQNQDVFLSAAEDIAGIVQKAKEMIGNAREQLYGNKNVLSKKNSRDIIETSTGTKVSYALNESERALPIGSMKNEFHAALTSREWVEYYNKVNEFDWDEELRSQEFVFVMKLNGKTVLSIYKKGKPQVYYVTDNETNFEEGVLYDRTEAERIFRLIRQNEIQRNETAGVGTDAISKGPNDDVRGTAENSTQGRNGRTLHDGDKEVLYADISKDLEESKSEVNENEREQSKDLLSDDGGKRKYSKSSGGQTRKVDGRSSRYKEGRKTASKRREHCQALKDAGHTRKRVILDHRCEVIPEKHYDLKMKKLVKENEKNGIDETILVVGGIEIPKVDSNWEVKTARGMFIRTTDGRKIVVVQYDNEYYSPEQINDHEIVHNDYGSERMQRVKNIILKTLPLEKRNELLGIIQDDYRGILDDLEGDALEELVANILSGMHYLSDSFLELSKAYWNKEDALIERWEYEVSKKSFAKAVEKGYASEMGRINRQQAYNEYVQLREYIMSVNNNSTKLKKIDCKEIGSNFYIWENKSKTDYKVFSSIPIEGNKDIINLARRDIKNGTYRGTEGFNTRANRIRSGKRGSTVLGSRLERASTHGSDDRLSVRQPESNERRYSEKSRRDTPENRVKYALDENGMWEIEHIFENDDPEAEVAMMRDWKALLDKYGAIPKGENHARDVSVPKKTAEDKKVSQTVRTILEAKATPDEAVPTIEKMVEDGVFSYDVYTDKQAIKDANSYIKEYGWDESLKDWFDSVEKGEVSKRITAMGWALYNNAANIAATTTSKTERTTAIKTSLNILDAMVRHQRSAAQALQATRVLKKLSPETQLYGVQKSVQAFQKEIIDRYGDKAPNLKIDESLAEQFLRAETQGERDAIGQKIYEDIGRQMPSRFIDKWNAWRYLAMLGTLRTHGRNILGNAFFAPVVLTKDLTATAIESVVNRVSGKKKVRGKALIKGNKADRALLKAAWDDYASVAKLISNGGKYSDSAMANQHIEQGRKIFKTKALEWARKTNSSLLELEDMWFSKPHYAYALAQYCKANNITAEQIKRGRAIEPARAYAIKEAQKATYRDTNAFSQMVSQLGKSNKNEKNVAKKALNTVIEGILPFRKTPANILVRGVEYSPLGLLKGLSYDLVQVSKGKMSATEAIDNISAGLTGTGLLVLGVYLAAQGLVRGHGEDEEEEKEFKELMGHQAYALELPNGESITLDWLAPEALPFFVGVNIWEATKGSDEEANFSTILKAVSNISEPMLEMSCLQSLNDLFESVGYATSNDTSGLISVLSSAATSYLTQGVPTLLGQAERTGEENRMTTYTEKNAFLTGDMQYTLGKISARIPVFDYHQIPYIDAWGRKEASGTALKRGFNNFLNPAYTSTIESSNMEKELLRLYEKTGESSVFPSRADKYFVVDGVRKDLTAEEYVRYATLKGEKSYKVIKDLVQSKAYKLLNDEEKIKAIDDAYAYANQKAKQAISNYEPEAWVSKADEFGSNVGNYLSFKANVSDTKADNGGKISKQEVVDIIMDMAQNDSETWLMYLSMYDSESAMSVRDSGVSGEAYMYFLESLNEYDKPTKSGKYGTYTQEEAYWAAKNIEGLSQKDRAVLWQSVNSGWKKNPFR